MRRVTLIALAALGLAALPAVALATTQFRQSAHIALTASRSGASSGIRVAIASSDPGAPGHKPKAATRLAVAFPRGTVFRFGSVTPCRVSVAQLTTPGGASCPAASQIGAGAATANAAPLPLTTIKAQVRAYARGGSSAILVVKSTVAAPTVIAMHASGSSFTIPIPTQTIGSGATAVHVVLTGMVLSIPASFHHGQALVSAGRCVAHRFAVRSHFTYADHSRLTLTSSSSCR